MSTEVSFRWFPLTANPPERKDRIVVRQKTVRTSAAPLAVTRSDPQREFSTRTRSGFERGTSQETQLTPGAASIAAGVTSAAYAA
jgi:hypothetical protein